MRLREGKSKEIYHVVRHEGTEPESVSDNLVVTLSSFTGKFVVIHVAKRPGMEDVELLASDDDTGEDGHSEADDGEPAEDGYWDSLTGLFGDRPPQKKYAGDEPISTNDTINIFSVASGHLYERFLRIMMLSVLKHTKNPVKFWFLKNFLSPNFKDFIPHMAEEYGFEYELVQYKWPHWLQQQTVKQRIIWGYKILFLDVLFPLSVKKIIFVDADQIVRVDMKELVDLPLEGAPYGYTPFCDDREDMEGFRFWKRGYWSNHLGNRRYHISALYVIDLVRFRQMAAGDRLRGQYQMLSQDPNSLSNLDQDLPNNMIHQVPIKSLPQEWLWCETWCSQESKVKAKTIDLCNNPLTKEPKLTSAVRIVPEWTDYDTEIKQLQDRVISSKDTTDSPDPDDFNNIWNHIKPHEEL